MKKLLLLLVAFIAFYGNLWAQSASCVPNNIHLTAVARTSTNRPETAPIDVKVEIATGNPDAGGTVLYCEQVQNIKPNGFGEFSLDFGNISLPQVLLCNPFQNMDNLAWQNCNLWYRLSYRKTGINTYTPIVTNKFSSIPYAFAARSAEKLTTPATSAGQVLTWNGTQWAAATPATGTTYTAGNGISISGNTITATSGVPAGTIMPWAGSATNVPAGWLICDGTVKTQSALPTLFNAIGTAWGNGTGAAGSFNLPDLRGLFLRGVDGGAGNDPDASTRTAIKPGGLSGNNVGSFQNDSFKSHNHSTPAGNNPADAAGRNYLPVNGAFIGNSILTGSTGGAETRPKNANVYYIIKA